MTGWRNVRRRWRSEQERQATGMGYEGIRGRTGARAWEVIHIYTGSFTPSPDPTPFYRRLISTRKGGLTTNGIHLLIPASLSNRSGPPHPRDSPRLHPYFEQKFVTGAASASWHPPALHGLACTDPTTDYVGSLASQPLKQATEETFRPEGRYRSEVSSSGSIGPSD